MEAAGRGQGRAVPLTPPACGLPAISPVRHAPPRWGPLLCPAAALAPWPPAPPTSLCSPPCSEAGGQGGAGGTGQRGWEAVLALLLWRAGAARPSPRSDHSLEERRLLLGGLWGQQLGFCLWRQVLQVVLAPDWSGQELPALWGHCVSTQGQQHWDCLDPVWPIPRNAHEWERNGIWMRVEVRLRQGRD